jgi:hypothetical protein
LDVEGFKIDGGSLLIIGTIFGRTYTNTLEGKVITYALNAETISDLSAVLDARFRSFVPVETATEALLRAQTKQTSEPHSKD